MADFAPISISVSVERIPALTAFYAANEIQSASEYVQFKAKQDAIVVTVYRKVRQGTQKVVFQGPQAYEEAKLWGEPVKKVVNPSGKWLDAGPQIGSDEVGTGDFFGPVVVASAFVGPKQLRLIDKYNIADSKTKTDEQIRNLGPLLIKEIPYSLLIVMPPKYNELIKNGYNMNSIKAWLHHQALYNLSQKHHNRYPLYIDQFCAPALFERYVKKQKLRLPNLTFATKGESKYPSVAAASMIARYVFLLQMDKLNEEYEMIFPLGAGTAVDEVAQRLIDNGKTETLYAVCKNNFKNLKKLFK